MKKINYIFKYFIIITIIFMCSGCFKADEMQGINIITTVYPLEYVLTNLYGNNSIVNSIYPDGVNVDEYKITEKEYKDYSKKDLFVYNGLSKDKDIALKLINKNKNILIMDSNYGMEQDYGGIEELWLNPSNLLMISQNIKNGLTELIDSKYIIDEINEKYNELKVELSELDAEIKRLGENANNKTIIIASPSLNFLSKYGFKTILLNDEKQNQKNIDEAISEIKSNNTKYVFILDTQKENEALKKDRNETNIEIIKIDSVDNMSDEQRNNKENYLTIMKKNIELLSKGVY